MPVTCSTWNKRVWHTSLYIFVVVVFSKTNLTAALVARRFHCLVIWNAPKILRICCWQFFFNCKSNKARTTTTAKKEKKKKQQTARSPYFRAIPLNALNTFATATLLGKKDQIYLKKCLPFLLVNRVINDFSKVESNLQRQFVFWFFHILFKWLWKIEHFMCTLHVVDVDIYV